jgi:hypothetical protein
MSWLDKTGSVEVALRKGLENFTYRAPFNQLNETEITHLIKTFSNRTEPRLLGMALQLADSEGSAIPLKDPEFVEKLADELMKRHS